MPTLSLCPQALTSLHYLGSLARSSALLLVTSWFPQFRLPLSLPSLASSLSAPHSLCFPLRVYLPPPPSLSVPLFLSVCLSVPLSDGVSGWPGLSLSLWIAPGRLTLSLSRALSLSVVCARSVYLSHSDAVHTLAFITSFALDKDSEEGRGQAGGVMAFLCVRRKAAARRA